MNPEWKAKWVDALRSNKYKQGREQLHSKQDEYCCLGVLCDVIDSKAWRPCPWSGIMLHGELGHYLSKEIRELVGLTEDDELYLAHRNDVGDSFYQIANIITLFM